MAVSYFLPTHVPIRAEFTTKDLKKLIDGMHEGECIKFRRQVMDIDGHFKSVEIYGTVVKKYPHIFMLDDGKCYQYKDYMLGKIF